MAETDIQGVIDRLAERGTSELESFFLAQGLGQAFVAPGRGWGRRKRVNEALSTAEREGRMAEVLRAAAIHFGIEDSAESGPPPTPTLEDQILDRRSSEPISQDERQSTCDPRRVFLVYGRNSRASDAVHDLLAAAGVLVVGWEEAVRAAGGGSPFTLDIVRAGMRLAQATVVLFTPDDIGCLDPRLVRTPGGEPEEETVTGRARQNVVLEAGMALANDDSKTVLVALGKLAGMSDLAGKHFVRLDDSVPKRKALLQRLRDMGCTVNLDGDRWITAGDVAEAVLPDIAYELRVSSGTDGSAQGDPGAVPGLLLSVGTPLSTFQPTTVATPSGRTVDLVLRCGVIVPDGMSGPTPGDPPVSRYTGEEREDKLVAVLDEAELTGWLTRQRDAFHLGMVQSWQPYGYNAGDASELVLEPSDDRGNAGPLSVACRVHTGWIGRRSAPGQREPGLRILTDLMFRVLEYDEDRRPSPTRHATTPVPAPASLRLDELFEAEEAVVTQLGGR